MPKRNLDQKGEHPPAVNTAPLRPEDIYPEAVLRRIRGLDPPLAAGIINGTPFFKSEHRDLPSPRNLPVNLSNQ